MNNMAIINQEINNDGSNALLVKLKNSFTDAEQQLFVESFHMYLNHDQENDYIIDLDQVYTWLGFQQKIHCKRLLLKHFKKDIDYKITLAFNEEKAALPIDRAAFPSKNLGGSGRNKETVLMNIKTFKKLSLKACTTKADSIHDYYIKMENAVQQHLIETFEKEKVKIKNISTSNVLIEQYINKDVFYIAFVKECDNYIIIKYGITQYIKDTLIRHQNMYGKQVYFKYILECKDRDKLERKVQTHTDLVSRHVKQFDGKPHNELLRLDNNFKVENLIELVKLLKESMCTKYSIELELSKELTKQMEINLELKKLEFKLEMRKLELQELSSQSIKNKVEQPIQQNIKDVHVIKEYCENFTSYSCNKMDTIKMSNLYYKFIEWSKIECITQDFSKRQFTSTFKKINIDNLLGIYDNKISNLNGNSGIRYRKFKVI